LSLHPISAALVLVGGCCIACAAASPSGAARDDAGSPTARDPAGGVLDGSGSRPDATASDATAPDAPSHDAATAGDDAPNDVCSPPYGTFGPGNWPPGCWRPYAPTGPLDLPIPPNPRLLASSAAIVATLTAWGPPGVLQIVDDSIAPQDDYGHPTFYSKPTDPTFTVHCPDGWCPEIEGLTLAIPAKATPAQGTDHHMTVIDQSTSSEWDFWEAPDPDARAPGQTLAFGGGGRLDVLTGSGVGSGGTASGFGNLAGIIRAQEWIAGTIAHALFGSGYCCDGTTYVWPAQQCDRPCSSLGLPDTNAPIMGMRVQLYYSDAEIAALGLPQWQEAIVIALAHYGFYWGDSGGAAPGWGAAGVESGQTYLSYGAPDPAVAYARSQGFTLVGDSQYRLDYSKGIDWTRLRVLDPCVTEQNCP
jgi:hypothetical protein